MALPFLRWNYQRSTSNRFVVDSPRFWRSEFHPRFRDLYDSDDFIEVCEKVNQHISFQLSDQLVADASENLYTYFSGHRFAFIPAKCPEAAEMFLSDLFFTLLDILPQISYTTYPLDEDDFNVISKSAETGKNDTSKVATNESNKSASTDESKADILTHNESIQSNGSAAENVDDVQKQNVIAVDDVFLSPQDQGRRPITSNPEYSGVSGITLQDPGTDYTTNVSNHNAADTTKGKTNTSSMTAQAEQRLIENNDARTAHKTDNEAAMVHDQENTTSKDDRYTESLNFDKSDKLQQFSDLTENRLWNEILRRLSKWILQMDIATSERNYLECNTYE